MGDGSFGGLGLSAIPISSATNVVVRDIDGDGNPDLITSAGINNGSIGQLLVDYGNGDGTFNATPVATVISSFTGSMSVVQSADFNNDNRPDFIMGYANAALNGNILWCFSVPAAP